ncbi:MAG: competence/damage-inducible protein A [Firmicutes bacterium]|nr:competence/damage-inducible protein A [Bacillota bacterium]
MKVSILAVGTELLFGQTINTNAAYLSKKLQLKGFNVMYHYVVGDNPNRLKQQLADAFEHADMVILTGGLGPTQDDLTKEMVAEYMGAELVLDQRVYEELNAFFAKVGRKMSANNMKQAYMPEGCTPFYNAAGTAPGFALERDGRIAICLPGPPREMSWLYENCLDQYLDKFVDKKIFYRVVRTMGIGESDLETMLLPLIDGQTDPTIATYAKEGEVAVRITSQRDSMEEAEAAVTDMIAAMSDICGEYIYSINDEEMNEVVVRLLKNRGLTVSSAESCTGGKFAVSITDVPGASNVFGHGYVTYSVDAKVGVLGLDRELIEDKGVVSAEVAEEMAVAARHLSGSDIAVSITGYAGPDADEGFNPGTAYIGYAYEGCSGSRLIKRRAVDRAWNRNNFTLNMQRTVYLILKGEL